MIDWPEWVLVAGLILMLIKVYFVVDQTHMLNHEEYLN